jgi:hypothetical protein
VWATDRRRTGSSQIFGREIVTMSRCWGCDCQSI